MLVLNIPTLSSLESLLVIFIAALLMVVLVALWRLYQASARQPELKAQLELAQQQRVQSEAELDERQDQVMHLQQQLLELQHKLGALEQQAARLQDSEADNRKLSQALKDAEQVALKFQQQLSGADDKIKYLESAEQRLSEQFELLSNRILEQKEQKLRAQQEQQQQQQKEGIGQLLNPLGKQLEQFRSQLQQNYENEIKQRHSLKDQIISLQQLNLQMSDEASKLSKALTGDNRQLGAWGELVLENVLNDAGMREGHEYQLQAVGTNQQDKTIKPDVLVKLPQQRTVIIDAKANLSHFERYFNAEDEQQAEAALKLHVQGLKAHVKGLSGKDYPSMTGLNTLDYVLMFVPVEQAYISAMAYDRSLLKEAVDKNVLIVGPSSLLVALRTIENVWKSEHQQRNARFIAERAAKLYDKFVAFSEDLLSHGEQLDRAQASYQQAMNKLSTGKGNLVRQAEQLKEMQIPALKALKPELLERSEQLNSASGQD